MIRAGNGIEHLATGTNCFCCTPQMQGISRRLSDFSRRDFLAGLGAAVAVGSHVGSAKAQPAGPTTKVLFRNLRLFDGKAASVQSGRQVLVEGNRIAAIDATNAASPADAVTIDCGANSWNSISNALPPRYRPGPPESGTSP